MLDETIANLNYEFYFLILFVLIVFLFLAYLVFNITEKIFESRRKKREKRYDRKGNLIKEEKKSSFVLKPFQFFGRKKKGIGTSVPEPSSPSKNKKLPDLTPDPVRDFDISKVPKKYEFKFWKIWFFKKFRTDKVVLINMELNNGMFRSFFVLEKHRAFKHDNKTYVLDNDSKYYSIDAKTWCYDFHESFALPIKRQLPIRILKEQFSESAKEIEYSSNPETLDQFVVSRIAEGIMKGQQLDDWMKQIRILVFISMLTAIVHLLLFMQKTGMLKSVTGSVSGVFGG